MEIWVLLANFILKNIGVRLMILATLAIMLASQFTQTSYGFGDIEKKLIFYPINNRISPVRIQ